MPIITKSAELRRSFYRAQNHCFRWLGLRFDRLLASPYLRLTLASSRKLQKNIRMVVRTAKWGCGGLIFALILFPAGAKAQDLEQTDINVVPSSVSQLKDGSSGSSLVLSDIDAASVSIDEKKSRVEDMLTSQRSTLGYAVTVLSEARKSKDIVKLNCVNEKLIQIKGLLKISEQASLHMYEAIADDAQDLINHEFTKIVVANQKSEVLKAEAKRCVGENSVYAGNTSVDVEIDGDSDGGGGSGGVGGGASAPPPGPSVPPVASTF